MLICIMLAARHDTTKKMYHNAKGIVVVAEQTRGDSCGELGWKRRGRMEGQFGIVKYWMGWANSWVGRREAG